MKEKRVLDILGKVDEKYIEEAAPAKRTRKSRSWVKWGAMAACLCLVVVASYIIPHFTAPSSDPYSPPEDYPPMIMVGGQLYQDSGKTTSAAVADKKDGQITSTCDDVPSKDDQSNFGTGFAYQYGDGNRVYVQFEKGWFVFIPVENNATDAKQSSIPKDYPPMIMVDGQLYKDSGKTTSVAVAGKQDGQITSTCDDVPTVNDQSNFGTEFVYQYGEDDTIYVQFETGWFAFIPVND